LATHKSAIKRAKQNTQRNLRNKAIRTRVKGAVKKLRASIEAKAADQAKADLAVAVPIIQKAAQKGSIHPNNASRKISRLTRQVNVLTAS
jgi:small subunit ribosomal protein S20